MCCFNFSAPFIEVCKRNDPNLSACLIRNVEIIRPKFSKGIPELGIPPMTPLVIPEAALSSSATFSASFKNIQLYGLDKFLIDELSFDLSKPQLKLGITIPFLSIPSEYHLKGRLLVLELDGNGPANGNYSKYICCYGIPKML